MKSGFGPPCFETAKWFGLVWPSSGQMSAISGQALALPIPFLQTSPRCRTPMFYLSKREFEAWKNCAQQPFPS